MIDLYYIEKVFILFLISSFCGWAIETLYSVFHDKKFVNRGFLIGPICPVYGCGVTLITVCLSHYYDDLVAVFFFSAILCGSLEYFSSYLMEKIFNARWWNYKSKFNINGRICLETMLLFAVAGVVVIRFIAPTIFGIIDGFSKESVDFFCIATLIILIIDIIVSFTIIRSIRKISESVAKEFEDSTEDISKKVKEVLIKKSIAYRRVIEAFPHVFADKVKNSKEKLKKVAENVKDNVIEVKDKTKEKTIKGIENVKTKTLDGVKNIKENVSLERIQKIKKSISKRRLLTISNKKNK